MFNRRLVGLIIDLAALAILLAACGGAAEPTSVEAPAAAPEAASEIATQVVGVEETVVFEIEKVVVQTVVVEGVVEAVEEPTAMPAQPAPATPVLSFAVVHDTFTELFRDDGSRVATVDTTGPASVHFSNDQAIVVDTQLARVFNPNGSQAGQGMPVSPGSTVAFSQERVAISHDSYVAVYSANGQPLINIDTPVPVEAGQAGGLLVLSGAGWTGVVHPDGRMLLNVQTQGRAALHAVDGRLVLVDDATVRFFDAAGRQIGSTVDRVEPASVYVVRNRVVLAHPGWTEIFTPDGAPVARITTAGLAAATPVDAYICLRDDGGIRLLDAAGNQIAAALPQPADAEVMCSGERLVVVHDGWVGIYRRSGESLANIATAGRGRLVFGDNRLIIADADVIRLLSPDGQPVAGAIRMPGATIQVLDGLLIATMDGQVSTFDLNGAPLAQVMTSGMPTAKPLPGGFLLIDNANVRLSSTQDGTVTTLASFDSSTKVVTRE